MQKVNIDFQVKKIRGSNKNDCVCQIHFHDANDNQIIKIEGKSNIPFGEDCILEDREVIVGIYGNKDSINPFYFLGLIVWNPLKI